MTFIAATAEAGTEDEQLVLDLRQRASGTITQQVFGLEPYIIIRPTIAEDDGELRVGIETGGGAELTSAGDFLQVIGEALQAEVTQEKIAAATADQESSND